MFRLPAALKAKGDLAEATFRAWLNQSGVGYLYVEQSPLNVPDKLRGKIKRPDYLVGIPHSGILAYDVKAKTAYDGHLLFEIGEVEKLARFASYFHVSVYFACLDIERADRHWWVPLFELSLRQPQRLGRREVLTFPMEEAFEVSFDEPFLEAMFRFGQRALER